MLKPGDKAPDFKLKSDDNNEVSLKDFRGKKIILYFYPKDNTSGCTAEACSFRDSFIKITRKSTVVIGISKDSTESHRNFKKKYNLPFQLLSDESTEILKKYNVWKEKSMYGRKYFGIERTTYIIDENGVITNIFNKVRVNGHVEEILKCL